MGHSTRLRGRNDLSTEINRPRRSDGRTRADVTRAAGWHGLFRRGRQTYLAAVVVSRGYGGYVFFFPHSFYASRFIGPYPITVAYGDVSSLCLPLRSRRASDRASIYLIGLGRPRGALNTRRHVLSSGSRKSRDASRACFLRNPRRSASDNSTCLQRKNRVVCKKNSSYTYASFFLLLFF